MRHASSSRVALYALLCGLSLSACDTSPSVQADSVVQLRAEDGTAVALTLTSGTPSGHRTFATREELTAYLDATESSPTLSANRLVWETTKHALPANTVALFDEAGSVTVGDIVYTATRDGVYSRPTAQPSSPLTVDLYYGEDGKGESAEYALVAANSSSPAGLRALALRNPEVRALADRIADAGGLVDADGTREKMGTNVCGNPYFWESCNFIASPGGYGVNAGGQFWSIRFLAYNESSGSLWYKKAIAGTQPQVLISAGWAAVGFNNPYSIGEYLGYKTRVIGDGNYFTTSGGNTALADCQGRETVVSSDGNSITPGISCYNTSQAESGRKSGKEAISIHDVRIYQFTTLGVRLD